MSSDSQGFDIAVYTTNLDIILKAAQDDYEQITFKRRAMQYGLLKTYLWLATAILGAQFMLYIRISDPSAFLPWTVYPGPGYYLGAFISIVLSITAFFLGIDSLRGKSNVYMPYSYTYNELADYAYDEYAHKFPRGQIVVWLIDDLCNAIDQHREIAQTIALKMRLIARLLLWSLAFEIMAIFSTMLYFPGS